MNKKQINPFEYIIYAAQRTRQLNAGAPEMVRRRGDKNPVIALRELERNLVDCDKIKDEIIDKYTRIKAPQIEKR